MKYKKGERQKHQGGLRNPPGGRPTNDEIKFKAAVAAAVNQQMNALAEKIAEHYVRQAFKNDRVLIHVIDLCIAKAKQEIETSEVKTFRVIAPFYPADRTV